MLPVFSEAVTGEKLVVGPPFFNKVNNPLFLILIFLMAVGPLISWRTTSMNQLKKLFLKPFIAASLVSIFLFFIDQTRPLASIAFGLSAFVILSILMELYKSVSHRKTQDNSYFETTKTLLVSRKRKYAAHLVHIGVALCTISITASSAYKIERDVVIKKGETITIGKYKVSLDEISQGKDIGYGFLRTILTIKNSATEEFITRLSPEKRIYTKSEEVTSEVDIYSNVLDDFYVALAGLEQPSSLGDDQISVIFKFFINPLQVWLWFSTLLMLIGSVILIFDRSKRKFQAKESVN
jgi:cytochrome c-type biogenesis protein CcmF